MGDSLKLAVLFLISVILSFIVSFFLVKSVPGSYGQDEAQLSKVFIDSYKMEFLPTLGNYLSSNWGTSWHIPQKSVLNLIIEAFWYTSLLQISTFIFILACSFILSFWSLKSRKIYDCMHVVMVLGTSFPIIFLAPTLIYLFSLKLGWTPLRFENNVISYLLPIICLSVRPLCFSTQILSRRWQASEFQDYFRVARAKGLSRMQAFLRHGLKNSAVGYMTQMAQILGSLLTGSVLIESLFSFPGLGTLFVESLRNRDLPVLLGVIFVFCLIYICVQIVVEKLQVILEPRAQIFRKQEHI